MGNHWRFCYWVFIAVFGFLLFPSRSALASCDCAYAFLRPNSQSSSISTYVGGPQGSGGALYRSGIFGNGDVYCDAGGTGANGTQLSFPVYVYNFSELIFTVSSSQAASCITNGVSSFNTTNYSHCITWTNDTGVGKAFTFFQDSDGCAAGTFLQDSITGYAFPGSIISRCWTNECAGAIRIYVSPFNGADRDDWVVPDNAIMAQGTNVVANAGPFNGNTPGNGINGGGNGFNPQNIPGGIQASNIGPATNGVIVWNKALTNGISGGGATSQDIYALGDALIRDADNNTDRMLKGLAGLTNGFGDGGASNAVRRFHVDATNQLAALISLDSDILTQHGSNGLAYRNATNLHALLRGDGIGTNGYGDVSGAEGLGTSMFTDNGYGAATNVASGLFGGDFTNELSGSESMLNVVFADSGDYPGAQHAQFDLRPSQWPSWLSAAAAGSRAVIGLLVIAFLYWQMWEALEKAVHRLNSSSQVVGRSLIAASPIGALGGIVTKELTASVITVGIAGAPTLWAGMMSSIGLGGDISYSFIEVAANAAGGQSSAVGAACGAVWKWIGAFIPFGVIMGAVINYWVFKILMSGFEQVWQIIFRLLPVLLFCILPGACLGSDWIIENRLSQPVGLISADVNSSQIRWYPPGVSTASGLKSSFTVAYGLGTTNGMTVNASSDEWTRLVVGETTTNSWVAYVYTEPEHGFKWGFERGFVLGCVSILTLAVLWFSRRTLRAGFGSYSE